MRGIIVYGRDGYEDGGEFVDQANDYVLSNDDVKLAIAEDLTLSIDGNEVQVRLPDGSVISRDGSMPEWIMMRSSDWRSALAFEKMGVPCFPPADYILAASDKVASHLAMSRHLASPATVLRRGSASFDDIGIPCIVKASEGFGGKSVKRIDFQSDVEPYASELEARGENPMYQELAASPDDLRVYIMGRRIMFAILRRASEGSDKANFCQGATGIPYEMSEEEKAAVQSAIDSFDCDLGFISMDFLFDDEGSLMFNEMNCFPGLAGLVQMTWQDGFVEGYVEHIERTVRNG